MLKSKIKFLFCSVLFCSYLREIIITLHTIDWPIMAGGSLLSVATWPRNYNASLELRKT